MFYLLLLGVLVVEYGHLPNYLTPYDWIANVLRIIHHTRSVADMVPIILNEWLLEIGYMNYHYGHGVAEWSLSIIPHKLAIMSLAGALIGLNVVIAVRAAIGANLAAAVRAGVPVRLFNELRRVVRRLDQRHRLLCSVLRGTALGRQPRDPRRRDLARVRAGAVWRDRFAAWHRRAHRLGAVDCARQ